MFLCLLALNHASLANFFLRHSGVPKLLERWGRIQYERYG
jgi:hypothetical protein